MLRPIIVLWLAAPALIADHRAQIEGWARSIERHPVWPEADLATAAYDREIAEDVEALLEEARSAPPGERVAFDRLEQLLLAHPELPQAAWWMAERHAIEAQHDRGAPEASGAADLARQLEGPRAAAFGLVEGADVGGAQVGALRFDGTRPGDRVFIDGRRLAPDARFEAGLHHVQVFRAQRRVSAAWVTLGQSPVFSLSDPTEPCSELDLIGTRAGAAAPEPLPGVACAEWAVARPDGAGRTLVAQCRGSSCGSWQSLGASAVSVLQSPPREPVEDGGVPSWVTWGALGLGSVVATGLILWQAGAFEGPASDTEFTFTGPTAIAF